MKEYKFLKRDEELNLIKANIHSQRVLLLNTEDKSGLSSFLKKLWSDFCESKKICFYIDGNESRSLSEQILIQIFSALQDLDLEKKLEKYSKKNIILAISKSLLYTLDMIPIISNIGSTFVNILECMEKTIDVDMDHISDYKAEKTIYELFRTINEEIYIIIDSPLSLSKESYKNLFLLFNKNNIRIILAIPKYKHEEKAEFISKSLPKLYKEVKELPGYFERPNDEMIKALFDYYDKEFEYNFIQFFEKYNRNIHVIMSYIQGFNLVLSEILEEEKHILKILTVLNLKINIQLLYSIFRLKNIHFGEIDFVNFKQRCKSLIEYNLIRIDNSDNIILNKNLVNELALEITYIDQQILIQNIIEIFNSNTILSEEQCNFAINHLSKDYSKRKRFVLKALKMQEQRSCVDSIYLDMIFASDSKEELLYICSLYYNQNIFDAPYLKLLQYPGYKRCRGYRILMAVIKERLHKDNYVEELEKLVNSSKSNDEKCLLLAILFVAYLNTNSDEKRKWIVEDSSHQWFYKNYIRSGNYYYLLRNISYYITNIPEAIENYNKCLQHFKNSDTVNYNRTLSNFICYLMKHDSDPYALLQMNQKYKEVLHILNFNDEKYSYLNVNFGLYLMKYKPESPENYFRSIAYSSGTTETPYIYAQINLAIYTLNLDTKEALNILDNLQYSVEKTTVKMTKQFYLINRCLIEYANGIKNYNIIDRIQKEPFRGDKKYVTQLYQKYKDRFDNDIPYSKEDWKELYSPGYLFYRYFDIQKLV